MASQDHRLGSSEPTQRSQDQIAPESFHVQVLKLRGLWDFLSMSGLLGASSLRKGVPGRFLAYGSLQEGTSSQLSHGTALVFCIALLTPSGFPPSSPASLPVAPAFPQVPAILSCHTLCVHPHRQVSALRAEHTELTLGRTSHVRF